MYLRRKDNAERSSALKIERRRETVIAASGSVRLRRRVESEV